MLKKLLTGKTLLLMILKSRLDFELCGFDLGFSFNSTTDLDLVYGSSTHQIDLDFSDSA
jgi:hypothetical protein